MERAGAGIGPDRGFMGEPFPKKSNRFNLRGKQLANGWKIFGGILHWRASQLTDGLSEIFFKIRSYVLKPMVFWGPILR